MLVPVKILDVKLTGTRVTGVGCESTKGNVYIVGFVIREVDLETVIPQNRVGIASLGESAKLTNGWVAGQLVRRKALNVHKQVGHLEPKILRETEALEVWRNHSRLTLVGVTETLEISDVRSRIQSSKSSIVERESLIFIGSKH